MKPSTVAQKVPDTSTPEVEVPMAPPPMRKTLERQGSHTVPVTRRLPQIRGGVCEFCGVIDPNVDSQFQYKLCPHFREIVESLGGGPIACSYCDASKDPNEVVGFSKMNVAEHPDKPGTYIAWCDQYTCSAKHEKRFMLSER